MVKILEDCGTDNMSCPNCVIRDVRIEKLEKENSDLRTKLEMYLQSAVTKPSESGQWLSRKELIQHQQDIEYVNACLKVVEEAGGVDHVRYLMRVYGKKND